jgi:hypothetical protein
LVSSTCSAAGHAAGKVIAGSLWQYWGASTTFYAVLSLPGGLAFTQAAAI